MTTEEFISEAEQVHGDIYSYDDVEIQRRSDKVAIICPTHGTFWQQAKHHLSGHGCPKCAIERTHTPKYTKETFITEARKVHGDKYDYSKVDFYCVKDKVIITCPIHGDFSQAVNVHLKGSGCPHCGHQRSIAKHRFNKDEFIRRANEVWNNKYDYSKVEWVNCTTPVTIICPEHGEFKQFVSNHLKGWCGCAQCKGKPADYRKINTFDDFNDRAIELFGPKFDFSKVEWTDSRHKIKIVCPEHGEFEILPYRFLHNKFGCPECNDHLKYSTEDYIAACKESHTIEYDYGQVVYTGMLNKVKVGCPKHGLFEVQAYAFVNGSNCPQCDWDKRFLTQEEFIRRAKEVHGNRYDYSNTVYKGYENKIEIGCKKHGPYITSVASHLRGRNCPICAVDEQPTSKGELFIKDYLTRKHLLFRQQYRIDLPELARNSKYVLVDFAVTYNQHTYLIEYNGKQHYEYVEWFYPTQTDFENQLRRDRALRNYCEANTDKFTLIEIKYDLEENEITEILNNAFNICR